MAEHRCRRLLAAGLAALLLGTGTASAAEWTLSQVTMGSAVLDMRAVPLEDGLIQVSIAIRSAEDASDLPEAFALYAGPELVGFCQPCDAGFFGYAEVAWADSLAVVPIRNGAEDGDGAVFLSDPTQDAPSRWEALARGCGAYTVDASALMLDEGLLNVQAIHTLRQETADPITGWNVYINGRFAAALASYRLPGDPETPFRFAVTFPS